MQLGSYGQKKKTPFGQPAYLAVQNKIKTEHIADEIKMSGPMTIDWNKESKTDVEANVKYLTAAGGKASFTHQAAKKVSTAPDTTFAYLMHKVKKWRDKKTEIADLEDDMAGLN